MFLFSQMTHCSFLWYQVPPNNDLIMIFHAQLDHNNSTKSCVLHQMLSD